MAVTEVKYDIDRSTARQDSRGYQGEEIWIVIFDNATPARNHAAEAITAEAGGVSIPAYTSAHPVFSGCYVTAKRAQRLHGPFVFEVAVQYGRVPEDGFQDYDDPLNAPAQVRWDHRDYEEQIDQDNDDKPIVNSAGITPDPPLTETYSDQIVQVRMNRSSYNNLTATQYKRSRNSDNFTIGGTTWPPGTVRCVEYSGEKVVTPDQTYYRVTVSLEFREQGWKKRFLDEGFQDKDGRVFREPVLVNGQEKDYIQQQQLQESERGAPYAEPQPLDGEGGLGDDQSPVWNEYVVLDELAYSGEFSWVISEAA